MHTVFSNSLATLLLLHAVLGCCWHHARTVRASEPSTSEVAVAAPCCGAHEHSAPCHHESRGPCPCHDECDVTCAYLPPQKTQLDAAAASLALAIPVIHPVSPAAEFAAVSVDGFRLCTVVIEPPVRLHLAHHVLLI